MNRRQFIQCCGAAGMAALTPGWLWAVTTQGESLTFAAINDLHIRHAGSERIVARAAEQINSRGDIAFTVIVGDLGTDGLAPEMELAKQALAGLIAPYFCVPGNHDFAPKEDNGYIHYEAAFTQRQWRDLAPNEAWAFIGLDTCNATKSNVTVPQERLDWLKAQIEAIPVKTPIALFGHHPFNPNTKAYRVENAEEVLALFAGHNLRLVASGHYHGNQVEERDGVLFVTNACCSTTRGNFDKTEERGYRVYTLTGETIAHEFVVVPHEDLME
jgi:3',5'-cyclic AMP phosphodiesterase CpdA